MTTKTNNRSREDTIAPSLPTGIPGLDILLRRGLRLPPSNNLIILIKGKPGSGKTTLGLQLAKGIHINDGNWLNEEQTSCYYTCEQTKKDLEDARNRLEPTEAANNVEIKLPPDDLASAESPFAQAGAMLQKVNDITLALHRGENQKYRVLVVDGLNLLTESERAQFELDRLVAAMRSHCRIGVIIYEPDDETWGSIDYQCDMIIELRSRTTDGAEEYFLTELGIPKARFQNAVLGWHQYKIRTTGIEVFPSPHFRLHQQKNIQARVKESHEALSKSNPEQPVQDKVAKHSVLSTLLGGIVPGSCTVLLGPRGCLKTELTFDFLRSPETTEGGLLLSLIDNQSTIVGRRTDLCQYHCLRPHKPSGKTSACYQHVYLLHLPPGCISSSELFNTLEERLACGESTQEEIQKIAFWDLTQLEHRFPLLAQDPLFLPGLIDYLKNSAKSGEQKKGSRQITSLLMGAPNAHMAQVVALMADNVVFCWPDTRQGDATQRGVAFYVDRVSGHQVKEATQLHFLPWGGAPTTLEPQPCVTEKLSNASGMIEAIQEMQGLSYRRTDKQTPQ
ncbi:MAG: RAD55 family ATPase [Armatimonadota bacterium]